MACCGKNISISGFATIGIIQINLVIGFNSLRPSDAYMRQ